MNEGILKVILSFMFTLKGILLRNKRFIDFFYLVNVPWNKVNMNMIFHQWRYLISTHLVSFGANRSLLSRVTLRVRGEEMNGRANWIYVSSVNSLIQSTMNAYIYWPARSLISLGAFHAWLDMTEKLIIGAYLLILSCNLLGNVAQYIKDLAF